MKTQQQYSAPNLNQAKQMAKLLAKIWLCPFCVVYQHLWDGKNDWRISLGRGKTNVAFIAN